MPAPRPAGTSGGVDVALGEHWLVLGMTGSGKTRFVSTLARELDGLFHVPQNILDTKPAKEFDDYPDLLRQDEPPALQDEGIQVWRPSTDHLYVFDQWFKTILADARPRIVWINELAGITKGQTDPVAPEHFDRLMKLARELGITVINETQEISKIPRNAKKQATHVIRLRLSPAGQYDQRIGNALVGRAANAPEPKGKWGFIYRRIDGQEPGREYGSVSDFF